MRATFLIAVVALGACGGKRTAGALTDLKAPWYALVEKGVDTSSTVALDADGTVWKASFKPVGSQPLTAVSTATAAQRAQVQSAFAALPATPETCDPHTSLQSGATRWPACTDAQGQFLPPYAAAVSALSQL